VINGLFYLAGGIAAESVRPRDEQLDDEGPMPTPGSLRPALRRPVASSHRGHPLERWIHREERSVDALAGGGVLFSVELAPTLDRLTICSQRREELPGR
jgi:hypothetical protein